MSREPRTTWWRVDDDAVSVDPRPRPQLLLVEDDDAIAEPLAEGLVREGYDVVRVRTGRAALAEPEPDLVLLDLGLPDIDGTEVCREIRRRSRVPIIMVTARGEEVDRVTGLELGADDYLVKPFGFRELIARMRAVARRADPGHPEGAGPLQQQDAHERAAVPIQRLGAHDELVIDRRARRVLVEDVEVALTPTEFELLSLFATDPGALCSSTAILEQVWGPHWYGTTKMIDVHVASLRKKLGIPGLVETVRGVGLRLAEQAAPGS